MKTRFLLCLLLSLPVVHARATFYLEPRLSLLQVSGTPNVGDLGVKLDSDFDRVTPEIAVGYLLAPRIGLELRYIAVADVSVRKVAPTLALFPGQLSRLPMHYYGYFQETTVTAVALPLQLLEAKNFLLKVTPLIQRADAKITFHEQSPAIDVIAPGIIYARRDKTIRAGGEVSAGYRLGKRAEISVHYTYLPLPGFDAHLFGVGFSFNF